MMQYLGVIEQRCNELMHSFSLKASQHHEGKAEVICIVRPHGSADASSEVFVLKGARTDFVDHLSKAHHGHGADTGHAVPKNSSDVALLPAANPVR